MFGNLEAPKRQRKSSIEAREEVLAKGEREKSWHCYGDDAGHSGACNHICMSSDG